MTPFGAEVRFLRRTSTFARSVARSVLLPAPWSNSPKPHRGALSSKTKLAAHVFTAPAPDLGAGNCWHLKAAIFRWRTPRFCTAIFREREGQGYVA